MNKKNIVIIVAVLVVLLVCGGIGIRYMNRRIQEGHARSCLITNADLADDAIRIIPEGGYLEAIANAEYIVGYYPVGAVLPESHPFAETYTSKRQEQLDRIAKTLKEATGMDYGTNWQQWRKAVSNRSNSTK